MTGKGKRILACMLALLVLFTGCVTTDTTVMAAAKKPTKITLNYDKTDMSVGDTLNLKVKSVTPKNASKDVTWTSSDKKVATVSSAGKVSAKKNGTVTITAKSKANKKVTAKCKITVYQATKKLTLSGDKAYTLKQGETVTLKATVTPAKGAQPIQWTSSDTKVAKVSANGKVTAVAAGTATITGKSGKKTVKVTITVSSSTEEVEPVSGTWKGIDWSIDKNGKLTLSGEAEAGTRFAYANPGFWGEYILEQPWKDYSGRIVSADVKVTGLTTMAHMFADCPKLTSVNFEGTDTSKVTSMAAMFINSGGDTLTISGLNTENTRVVGGMFAKYRIWNCTLKSLDISCFDLSNVNGYVDSSFLAQDITTVKLPKVCPAEKVKILGTWKDEAGNTYTDYLPETTGTSFTITKVSES